VPGRSIRARATLNAVLVMGAAVALAALALVVLLHRSLLRDLDTRTKLRLHDVAALAERGDLPSTLGGTDEDATVAQVVAGGRVVAQSPIIRGSEPLARFVPPAAAVTVRTVGRIPVPGVAGAVRVAAIRVTTPGGPAVVYAAASLEPVNDSINALKALLAAVAPALVLVVGAGTWRVVGRTLRPVEAIRAQVADISATRLAQRVPEPGTGDEIQRLAQTMNAMLERLEDSTNRQRSFVSDAAHELRSPLAALQAELDVAARRPGEADWPALLGRLGAGTRRMERLVEDLLLLAVAEEKGPPVRTEVDLDDIVIRQLEPLRATSRLTIDLGNLGAVRIWGNSDQLERVVTNLLENAERYAAGTISIGLAVVGGMAELVVADDGPGISPESRERIFERFARVDEARDRRSGGAGLGLAIARRIVEDHGGTIGVAGAPRGARLVVRLPVSRPALP
jgi:signal transduction histidine kinase